MHAHTLHRMLVAPLLYSGQRGRQPCLSKEHTMLVKGEGPPHASCRGREWPGGGGVAAQLKVGAARDEQRFGARELLDVVAQVHLRGSV